MKYCIFLVLIGILLFSCSRRNKFEKEFNANDFDANVINSLPLYDSLRDILIEHLDTIVKFRSNRKGERSKDFFIFNWTDAQVSDEGIDDMPMFLYPVVEKLCIQIGKNNISGFILYPDSAIKISVRSVYKTSIDASVNHQLWWKRRIGLNPEYDFFIRDTIPAPNWTYLLSLDERNN